MAATEGATRRVLIPQSNPPICHICARQLRWVSVYEGGRGYVSHLVCPDSHMSREARHPQDYGGSNDGNQG
jgi:hypothetical protein